MFETIKDVIARWPSIEEFAVDVGVSYWTASKWQQRNFVGSEYFSRIVEVAKKRRIKVSADDLAQICAWRFAA